MVGSHKYIEKRVAKAVFQGGGGGKRVATGGGDWGVCSSPEDIESREKIWRKSRNWRMYVSRTKMYDPAKIWSCNYVSREKIYSWDKVRAEKICSRNREKGHGNI